MDRFQDTTSDKVCAIFHIGVSPQIMMAKSFSGAKYNINTEYEQKKLFLIFDG